jgi:hypothetical protein
VLLTVTICAALDDPTNVAAKVNSAGLTFRPETAFPAPLRGTVAGITPEVAEETVNVAEFSPAAIGVKITCTVQLDPAISVAAQVVVPVEKLPAEAPLIWKPTLAAATPPVFPMVKIIGALDAPTLWEPKVRLAGLTLKAAGCAPVPARATVCVRSASETVSTPA